MPMPGGSENWQCCAMKLLHHSAGHHRVGAPLGDALCNDLGLRC